MTYLVLAYVAFAVIVVGYVFKLVMKLRCLTKALEESKKANN